MNDIQIAKQVKLDNIIDIAKKIGLSEDNIEMYGKYKAKIDDKNCINLKKGNIVLVTAISPTPLGEGKTTISIGLADGLCSIGKKAVLALREPSLGPVFGIKGGATGGGYAQIAPMEDINLHFTGDIHAITSANNLISALIDNHIYYGNELEIEKVTWKRCLDLNDRQLRTINTGLSKEKKIVERMDGFDISVASEIMAILCLANSLSDLKRRIGNIVVGYNKKDAVVTLKMLKGQGAVCTLLKDAFKPNLVQTLEKTPAIIHGGPFANIAHGCNSIVATKLAQNLGEIVITECGFGADLGAQKYLDIKCRNEDVVPNVVVVVATLKALKFHGNVEKDNIQEENIDAIKIGFKNLKKHIDNIQNVYGLKAIVAINKYSNDSKLEIDFLEELLQKENIKLSLVESYEKGSSGAVDLAKKVVETIETVENNFKFSYEVKDDIKTNISSVVTKIYGAKKAVYSEKAEEKIKQIENLGYGKLPVCIAKTQYSFSDNSKNLDVESSFDITVTDVILKAGAEFLVVITGKVMTMPGLPKNPAAENIDIDENGEISGIF